MKIKKILSLVLSAVAVRVLIVGEKKIYMASNYYQLGKMVRMGKALYIKFILTVYRLFLKSM